MGTPPRHAWIRGVRLLVAVALLLMSPGMRGLEVVYHLAHGSTPSHERIPHLEPAGVGSHADHCQGDLAAGDARIASAGNLCLRTAIEAATGLPSPPSIAPLARTAWITRLRGPPSSA